MSHVSLTTHGILTQGTSLHAVTIMLREDVNCGPEPCQRGPALTFPISYLCIQVQIVIQIVFSIQCHWARE
jgi:hypothetical protein